MQSFLLPLNMNVNTGEMNEVSRLHFWRKLCVCGHRFALVGKRVRDRPRNAGWDTYQMEYRGHIGLPLAMKRPSISYRTLSFKLESSRYCKKANGPIQITTERKPGKWVIASELLHHIRFTREIEPAPRAFLPYSLTFSMRRSLQPFCGGAYLISPEAIMLAQSATSGVS